MTGKEQNQLLRRKIIQDFFGFIFGYDYASGYLYIIQGYTIVIYQYNRFLNVLNSQCTQNIGSLIYLKIILDKGRYYGFFFLEIIH